MGGNTKDPDGFGFDEIFSTNAMTERFLRFSQNHPQRFCVVHVAKQKLTCVLPDGMHRTFRVSTARNGIGSQENSFQTPPGIHRIAEKIGDKAPSGTIFKDRLDTGTLWKPSLGGDNLVLTRILRLEGLEQGVNRGQGIDSFQRYIYLHGTNKEHRIGTPFTHGCVCLTNSDIIELFDLVREDDLVVID